MTTSSDSSIVVRLRRRKRLDDEPSIGFGLTSSCIDNEEQEERKIVTPRTRVRKVLMRQNSESILDIPDNVASSPKSRVRRVQTGSELTQAFLATTVRVDSSSMPPSKTSRRSSAAGTTTTTSKNTNTTTNTATSRRSSASSASSASASAPPVQSAAPNSPSKRLTDSPSKAKGSRTATPQVPATPPGLPFEARKGSLPPVSTPPTARERLLGFFSPKRVMSAPQAGGSPSKARSDAGSPARTPTKKTASNKGAATNKKPSTKKPSTKKPSNKPTAAQRSSTKKPSTKAAATNKSPTSKAAATNKKSATKKKNADRGAAPPGAAAAAAKTKSQTGVSSSSSSSSASSAGAVAHTEPTAAGRAAAAADSDVNTGVARRASQKSPAAAAAAGLRRSRKGDSGSGGGSGAKARASHKLPNKAPAAAASDTNVAAAGRRRRRARAASTAHTTTNTTEVSRTHGGRSDTTRRNASVANNRSSVHTGSVLSALGAGVRSLFRLAKPGAAATANTAATTADGTAPASEAQSASITTKRVRSLIARRRRRGSGESGGGGGGGGGAGEAAPVDQAMLGRFRHARREWCVVAAPANVPYPLADDINTAVQKRQQRLVWRRLRDNQEATAADLAARDPAAAQLMSELRGDDEMDLKDELFGLNSNGSSSSSSSLATRRKVGRRRIRVDDIRFGPLVGSGSFGSVVAGKWHGHPVAVKVRKGQPRIADAIALDKAFSEEVHILSKVNDSNRVVRMFGVINVGGKPGLVMRLYPVALSDLIDAREFHDGGGTCINPVTMHSYLCDVAEGLRDLHRRDVIFRDLKPENCLVDRNNRLVLADFGISIEKSDEPPEDVGGTAQYMAPENFQEKARLRPSCDIWSLGCLVIHMWSGKPPWSEQEVEVIIDSLTRRRRRPTIPKGMPKLYQRLLRHSFKFKPRARPSAQAVLNTLRAYRIAPLEGSNTSAGTCSGGSGGSVKRRRPGATATTSSSQSYDSLPTSTSETYSYSSYYSFPFRPPFAVF